MLHLSTYTILKSLVADLGLSSSDAQYLVKRLRNEGTKFVTSTLPKLWKCVSWSFQVGFFDRTNPEFSLTHFAWKGRSLRYFRSLLDRIFDQNGLVLPTPDATAVFKLRMLCEYLYKLCLPFSEVDLQAAQGSYRKFEESYPSNGTASSTLQLLEEMRWAVSRFYPELTRASVSDILEKCHPRYGPGSMNLKAVHGAEDGQHCTYWEYKFLPLRKTGLAPKRLGAVSGFLKPYPGYRLRPGDRVKDRKLSVKRECEILFVPKNADGPRVISRENPFDIRLQMAYFDWSASLMQRVTFGHVQFTDQTLNRASALQGSLDGSKTCADLKEASDRVSLRNVTRVFQNCPGLLWFIRNTRSTHARLPDGDVLLLKKLAGMGSGLTFPTMAMYIYLAAIVGMVRQHYGGVEHIKNVPNIVSLWSKLSKAIRVFGDDLVIDAPYTEAVYCALEDAGLRVNHKKSHSKGPFRESCGGDYLNGIDVTPIRLKLMGSDWSLHVTATNHGIVTEKDHHACLQLERHCRELISKDMISLSEYYYRVIEKRLGKLPGVSGSSPVLGRYCPYGISPTVQQKAYVPVARTETVEHLDPYRYIGASLRPTSAELYSSDPKLPFGELAVPHQVKLKKRLVTIEDLNGVEQTPILLRSAKSWHGNEMTIRSLVVDALDSARKGVPIGTAFCLHFSQLTTG